MNIEEVKFDEELYKKNIEENEFANISGKEDGVGEELDVDSIEVEMEDE